MTSNAACLIGHTGFVGSNLARHLPFTALFNSQNIEFIRGQQYDTLICAGVSAIKWWANQNPQEDWSKIQRLLDLLSNVKAKNIWLISTIDVYPVLSAADETFDCHSKDNHPYGTHRLKVEDFFQANYPHANIIRLPALFGPGLKKNLIHDLLKGQYLDTINPASAFQYYDVSSLAADIQNLSSVRGQILNFFTEPLLTAEIVESFFPDEKIGAKPGPIVKYNLHTRHADLFGNSGSYILSRTAVKEQLSSFIRQEKAKRSHQ